MVKVWRGTEKIPFKEQVKWPDRGRYFFDNPKDARWYAQRAKTLSGKISSLDLTKEQFDKAKKLSRSRTTRLGGEVIVESDLLKKQKTDILRTIMARAGNLSKLALRGLSVVASLPAQVVVMTLTPTDANADEVNMTLEDFATLAEEAKPKKEMMAAGGNVPSTDIKDYYRRAWGIGDRAKFKPGGIVEPGVAYYARKSPTKINEELFTKIDDLIAEAGRAGQVLGKKGLGEGLGYKVVEKGKTSGQGGLNKIIKAWEKARGKTFTFKPAKFTANSPKVKQVIELFENGMSKKAIEFKTGISRKEIRSIFHQFAPEYIGDANLPKGEGRWAVQRRRFKIIKELTDYWKDKPGGKKILEEMNQKLRSIKLKNAEILKMTDKEILNNKTFKEAMNLDVKGLKIGEGINFNRYKHLTDAEYIAKVKAMAKTNQFFQPEHFIAINKKNPASMLPKNIYTAVGKTGGQLEVLKNFVLTNPDDIRTKDINNFLKNQNLLEKKSVLKKAFNLAKSITKPVLKHGLKVVPIAGTYLGLQDVAKAQEMGLDRPEELATAYYASPEIAKGWKDIREYDYKDRAAKEWENIQESWKNRGTGTEETVEVEDEVMFAKGGIASLKK